MHPQVTQHLRSVTRSNFPPIMGKPPDLLRFLCTPAFLLSSPRPIRCICTQLSVALQSARHRFDIFFLMGRHFVTELLCFYTGQHKLASEFLRAVYSNCPNSSQTLISISKTIRLTILIIKHICPEGRLGDLRSLHLPHRNNSVTHFGFNRHLINMVSIIIYFCTSINRFIHL